MGGRGEQLSFFSGAERVKRFSSRRSFFVRVFFLRSSSRIFFSYEPLYVCRKLVYNVIIYLRDFSDVFYVINEKLM